MCLILFAYHVHPDYPLILAANRDEFHARPAQPAHWWDEHPDLLAGRDLSAGGTWMGITRAGRIAAVTNYRDPASHNPTALSRGELTTRFLLNQPLPEDYTGQLLRQAEEYNGYNLLYGSIDKLHYFSNHSDKSVILNPGIHGLSNHLLDTPWPKVTRGKQALSRAISQQQPDIDQLWDLLADRTIAPDHDLPETGIGLEWERTLSAIQINGDHYGTRASTLLLVKKDGTVQFIERTFKAESEPSEVSFTFSLKS